MIVHSRDKPYQCDQCHKRFKYSNYLSKHKKKYCGNDGYRKRWQKSGVKKPSGRRSGGFRKGSSSMRVTTHTLDDDQGDDDEVISLHEEEEEEEEEEEQRQEQQRKSRISRYEKRKEKIPLHISDDGDWKKAWIKQGYK